MMTPCRNLGASGPAMEMSRREDSAARPDDGCGGGDDGGDDDDGGAGAGDARDAAEEKFRRAAEACVRQLAHTKPAGVGRVMRRGERLLCGRMLALLCFLSRAESWAWECSWVRSWW